MKFSSSSRKILGREGLETGYLHMTYKGKPIPNLKVKKQIIEEFRIEQGNQCAICFKDLETPFLDHDHTSREVRGLLCPQCNTGLGAFDDNPIRIANAIRYLTGQEIPIPDPT